MKLRNYLLSALLISSIACAAFGVAACTKKDPVLRLSADGGSVSEEEFTLAAGSALSDVLGGVTVSPEEGLEFAGWYEGNSPVAEDRVMPEEGLSLTARFYAEYTANVYSREEGGQFPSSPLIETGKAVYHLPFTYECPYGELDSGKESTVSTDSLGKNDVFTAYVVGNPVRVTFDINLPKGADLRYSVPAEQRVTAGVPTVLRGVTILAEGSVPFRFMGWSEEKSGSASYPAGSFAAFTEDTFLYAVWERGYTDLFGGDDVLYVSDEGGLTLVRAELGERRGEYDAQTGAFSFQENGETILLGKLLATKFYYYRDTVERTYENFDETQTDTLELKAGGVAEYTAGGNVDTGTYTIEEETELFRFTGEHDFRFDLQADAHNTPCFVMEGDEEGYYTPGEQARLYGVTRYYLDGFGGGKEYYSEENPFLLSDGSEYTELYLDYYEIDSGDGFVTYRATSYTEDDYEGRTFDFRVQKNGSGDGTMLEGDFLTGHYTNADDENGTELYLDGFGKGTYGEEEINYKTDVKHWYAYNSLGMLSAYYDLTVTFSAGGENYRIRTRSLFYGRGDGYEFIDENETFGEYVFDENGVTVSGETYEAVVYFFQGFSEMMNGDNCVILLIKTENTYNGEAVYELYDTHDGDPLTPDENGRYHLDGGTLFTLDDDGRTAHYVEPTVEAEGQEIVFLEGGDGAERLVVDQDGVAKYTPAGGTEREIEYTSDAAYGSPAVLVAVYTFRIGANNLVFACYLDGEAIKAVEATAVYTENAEIPDRILLFEKDGQEIAEVGTLLQSGGYYYCFEGTLTKDLLDGENEYTFVCGEDTFDSYAASLLGYDNGFDFRLDGNTFTRRVSSAYTYQNNADELTLDGYGKATLQSGGQITDYGYEVVLECTYTDPMTEASETMPILYGLTDLASGNLVRFFVLDEDSNTFRYPDDNLMMILPADENSTDQLFLDGCGHAYLSTLTGTNYSNDTAFLLYKKTAGKEEFSLFAEGEEEPSLTVLVATEYVQTEQGFKTAYYVEKDPAQTGDFEVVGGGSLHGSGYGAYEDGTIVELATFTDRYGVVHYGILEIGNLEDTRYNSRSFEVTAAGFQIRFTEGEVQTVGGYQVFYEIETYIFDLDGDDRAQLRTEWFGAYRLYEKGRAQSGCIYLDGHGNAELYRSKNAEGNAYEIGAVEYDATLDCYRYKADENIFLFNLYSNSDGETSSYFYAKYNEAEENTILSADWSVLKFDGFVNGVYVNRYGDTIRGTYGYITDWLVVLYPYDGSRRVYFEIEGNSFSIPAPEDGFLTDESGETLYAYTLDFEEGGTLKIKNGIKHIYDGVFAGVLNLTSVDLNEVVTIGDEAFAFTPSYEADGQTSSLVSVSSENVESIGARAFARNTALQTVNFPHATAVGEEAFWNSNAGNIVLGNLQSVGSRAFAGSRYFGNTTLDLSAVEDAGNVEWGDDLFVAVENDEVASGVIPVNILVKDVNALSTFLAEPAFAAVKNRIGLKNESASGQYFDLVTGTAYSLSGGLLATLKVNSFDGVLVPDTAVGIVLSTGSELTMYSFKADGSGYEENGTKLNGDLDSFALNGSVLVAAGRDVTFTASGKNIALYLALASDGAHNHIVCTPAVTVNDTEIEKVEYTGGALEFALDGKSMRLTFPSAGECVLSEQGDEFTLETSDEVYRATFRMDGGSVMLVKFETQERYDWEDLALKIVKTAENTFRVYNNQGNTEDVPILYTVTYDPADGGSITVEEAGQVARADGYDSAAAFVEIDPRGAFVGIYKLRTARYDYWTVLTCEKDGSNEWLFTVTAQDSNGTVKTFSILLDDLFDETGGSCTITEQA